MKDVKIRLCPSGSEYDLFVSNWEGFDGKFLKRGEPIDKLIDFLERQKDVPEMEPSKIDHDSQEFLDGHEAARLVLEAEWDKNATPISIGCPYNKRYQYERWNNWSLGYYYGMK